MIKLIILEETTSKNHDWLNLISQQTKIKCEGIFNNFYKISNIVQTIPCDIILIAYNQDNKKIAIETIQNLAKYKEIQVLVYTSLSDDEHIFEALKAGANGYILKDTAHSKVIQAIHELHDGGVPMSPFVAKRVLQSFQKIKKSENYYQLSPREHQIIQFLKEGLLYKEIANQLELSLGTVKQYTHTIYRKLKVENRTEALNKYFSLQNHKLQY